MTAPPVREPASASLHTLEVTPAELAYDCHQQLDALVLLAGNPCAHDLPIRCWHHLLSPISERLQWLVILLEQSKKTK